MVDITIASLIYRSKKYADAIYSSVLEFTPKVRRGEAEFFFMANDPTPELMQHLKGSGYPHFVNYNPHRSEDELYSMGYGEPEYIHRVYRGWNECIRCARGDIVVLVNSDNILSPDWLENLLKYLSPRTIVCSKLVERRHPTHGIFPSAYHREFGSHPDNFNREAFLRFCERVRMTGLEEGGAYMPCAFYKTGATKVGLYPEGNIAGSSFHNVVDFGDRVFFKKLSRIDVKHVTALDSIAYHFKEGESDETQLPSTIGPAGSHKRDEESGHEGEAEITTNVVATMQDQIQYLTMRTLDLALTMTLRRLLKRGRHLIFCVRSLMSRVVAAFAMSSDVYANQSKGGS